jgi:hypothetical protein
METVHSAMIDPPEPVVDRNCPLHGSAPDPDDARDAATEREWFAPIEDHDLLPYEDEGDEPDINR